jgi:hypothetical protein
MIGFFCVCQAIFFIRDNLEKNEVKNVAEELHITEFAKNQTYTMTSHEVSNIYNYKMFH